MMGVADLSTHTARIRKQGRLRPILDFLRGCQFKGVDK